jgi:hypothetical protein
LIGFDYSGLNKVIITAIFFIKQIKKGNESFSNILLVVIIHFSLTDSSLFFLQADRLFEKSGRITVALSAILPVYHF